VSIHFVSTTVSSRAYGMLQVLLFPTVSEVTFLFLREHILTLYYRLLLSILSRVLVIIDGFWIGE
jgi:hypothetical protein